MLVYRLFAFSRLILKALLDALNSIIEESDKPRKECLTPIESLTKIPVLDSTPSLPRPISKGGGSTSRTKPSRYDRRAKG